MFEIQFKFPDRRKSDLQQLNRMLASLSLQELKLEDTSGYLATTRKQDSENGSSVTSYRYGFDRGTLICTPAENAPGYHYQIDTQAVSGDINMEADHFHDLWCSQHPDRVMRTLVCIGFDKAQAFVIVHHEKTMA